MALSEERRKKREKLQAAFLAGLDDRLLAIRELVRKLKENSFDKEGMAELHMLVHNLNGSTGTYGLMSISQEAGKLENQLVRFKDGFKPPSEQQWQTIDLAIANLDEFILIAKKTELNTLRIPAHPIRNHRLPLIHIVEDDKEQAGHLSEYLREEGFRTEIFYSPQAFRYRQKVDLGERPAAVIMDLIFPGNESAGAELIAELEISPKDDVPVIVLSVRDELQARLEAFRAGACRYLTKPYDKAQLIGILDAVTGRQPAEPFRVLMVDDDEAMLEAEAQVLVDAGMEVRALSDPLQTLKTLQKFVPDVIVLDVYMPGATGPELAAVIRERDAQLQTPILFLSSEKDMSQQLQALSLGGDDFLVKPIKTEHFISAVTARARRARQNRAIQRRLEIAIYEREREHLALNLHAIVSIADENGDIIQVNDRFCEVSGYSRDELLGQNHRIVKSDEHTLGFYQELWRTITEGQTWHGEFCNRRKDGSLYWVASTIAPFLNAEGKPYQYVSIRTDITETKQHQQVLETIQENLAGTLESTADGILAVDGQGKVSIANRHFYDLWRIPEDMRTTAQLENTLLNEVEPQLADPLGFRERTRQLYQSGDDHLDVIEFRDGRVFERFSRPLVFQGNIAGRVWSFRDITEAKKAEEKLRQTALFLDSIIDNVPDMVFLKHASDLRFALLNKAGEQLLGHSRSELIGRNDHDFFPKEQADFFTAKDRAVLQKNEVVDIPEEPIDTPSGTRILHTKKLTLRDAYGQPEYLLGISQDITKEVEIKESLIVAREEADRANRAKSEFLSSMSHELRTPMNAIIGFSQLLDLDRELKSDQQENVKEIRKAADHLMELINEVLDLAKVESGNINLSLEPEAVVPIVEECIGLVATLAEKRDINISHSRIAGARIRTDRTRLKQVLLNLLSNAIKYNRDGGSVEVKLQTTDDGKLRVAVSDTGAGIAEDKLDQLFQPFNRLDAENSEIEGTGIGLSLTRRIVELMGGKVDVESQLGVGSTFWIELPIDSRLNKQPTTNGSNSTHSENTPKVQTGAYEQRYTILYVEDNPANLKLVAKILGRRPHVRLLSAHTPSLGIDLAETHHPDLILLDINLPGMSGYQVLNKLRSNSALNEIPVVAVTANAMPKSIARGKQAGFDEYLTKPLDVAKFNETIDRLLLNKPDSE